LQNLDRFSATRLFLFLVLASPLLLPFLFGKHFKRIFTFTFTTKPCSAIPLMTAHPQTLKTSAAACNKTHASRYVFDFYAQQQSTIIRTITINEKTLLVVPQ
jgi:hypothetical protein